VTVARAGYRSRRLGGRRALLAIVIVLLVCAVRGADVSAADAYTISGVVTAQNTGLGIAETEVEIDESVTGVEVAATSTAMDGTYSLSVPAGSYDIAFVPPFGSGYEGQVDSGELVEEDITLDAALKTARLSQTVSFTSSAPAQPTVGSVYVPSAVASSGLPVSFSIDPTSAPGACSLSEGEVSFTGVGTCVIDANQGGDETYLPAAQEQQPIEVGKASQTVSFTSSAPAQPTVGSVYVPSAVASSGLPVSFSIDPTSGFAVCSVFRGIVSFTNSGSCVIDANQPGNAGYFAAPQMQQRVAITAAQASTTTALSLSTSAVEYGREQAEIFNAATTSAGGGTIPNGTVSFKNGTRTLCKATISLGRASCALSGTSLKPGNYSVVGVLAGSSHFSSSTSVAETFAVSKDSTVTSLTLSAASVAYGSEQTEAIKVTTSAGGGVVPTGSVTVKAGGKTLCKAKLSGGSGSCSPKATALARGSYALEASFPGSSTLALSVSGSTQLEIS
jgi:Bacterial Ig-like domain (group 3)